MAITAIRSLGVRLEARTPKSYAARSRLWKPPPNTKNATNRKATQKIRPANQSDFQKAFFMDRGLPLTPPNSTLAANFCIVPEGLPRLSRLVPTVVSDLDHAVFD